MTKEQLEARVFDLRQEVMAQMSYAATWKRATARIDMDHRTLKDFLKRPWYKRFFIPDYIRELL